jgi:hypothetical protein
MTDPTVASASPAAPAPAPATPAASVAPSVAPASPAAPPSGSGLLPGLLVTVTKAADPPAHTFTRTADS